jgi:Sortase domain
MPEPARRLTRIAAVAAGTLALLVAPAVLGDVLADDGGAPVSAGGPAAGDPPAAPPASPPDAGAPGPPGGSPIPVPDAPRPAPLGVPTGGLAPSPPVRLSIPELGVSSVLEHLGVREDGTLAPPVDFARPGWFAEGVEPGQPGPAVIAGHVDSRDGPAVFYRLRELAAGDVVELERADGSTVTFRVTEVATYPKDAFPTEAVYGPVPGAELRLVTCTGTFDDDTGHYVDNLVVFATLA